MKVQCDDRMYGHAIHRRCKAASISPRKQVWFMMTTMHGIGVHSDRVLSVAMRVFGT